MRSLLHALLNYTYTNAAAWLEYVGIVSGMKIFVSGM
jgi:hypothetical protein